MAKARKRPKRAISFTEEELTLIRDLLFNQGWVRDQRNTFSALEKIDDYRADE